LLRQIEQLRLHYLRRLDADRGILVETADEVGALEFKNIKIYPLIF